MGGIHLVQITHVLPVPTGGGEVHAPAATLPASGDPQLSGRCLRTLRGHPCFWTRMWVGLRGSSHPYSCCYTVTLPGPFPLGSKAHTGLTCHPGREDRTALMTFDQLLYLTPNKLLPLWKQPGPFFGYQGLLTTLFSMQGGI